MQRERRLWTRNPLMQGMRKWENNLLAQNEHLEPQMIKLNFALLALEVPSVLPRTLPVLLLLCN